MIGKPVNRNAMLAALLVVVALGFVGLRWFDQDSDTGDPDRTQYARGDGVRARDRGRALREDGDFWSGTDAERAKPGKKGTFKKGTSVSRGRRGSGENDGVAGVRGSSQTLIRGRASRNSAKSGFASSKSRSLGAAGASRQRRGVSPGLAGTKVDSSRLSKLRDRGPTGRGSYGEATLGEPSGDPDGDAALQLDSEDEDGKLFDPLSSEVLKDQVDRGREEDPTAVSGVEFLKDEGGVYAGEDSVLSFPAAGNIDGAEGTINLVVEPDWNGDDEGSRSLLVIGEQNEWKNRIRVVKNNNYLRAMYFDSEGTERGLGVEINDWRAGEQHQITVGWSKAQQQLALYVDGALVAERPLEGEIVFGPAATIEVGSAANREYRGAASKIFDLTTHDSLLAPGDL